MASKFPAERDGKVKLRTRKVHDMTWSCDIHRKPIKRYCKEHKTPVCHPCATKEHYHKPCKLYDIEDVILERRRKLNDKQLQIEEMKKQLKTLSSKLESTATSASKHLQSVNDELKVAFEDKIRSVKDKEKRSICLINEEADEEIKIIYEKEEADEEMQIINEKRERRIISCHEEAEQQQLMDISTISTVNQPVVRGSISDDEICVRDETNNATYVTNISTQHTQTVTEGGSNMYITSCASIDSNVIVCGVWRKDFTCDSLDRCIALCDRQWMMIRHISLPRNNPKKRKYNDVHVDVDMEGMILAAPYDQPNIYVIKPAGGKIENTITMQGKVVMDDIQALSSGDIVVNTGCLEYTAISRSGEVKFVIRSDEWKSSQCHVDKLTDALYITYWDTKRNIYAVDQVSCDGIIEARRIVEYEASDRCAYISLCLVTLSGNLLTCNGDSLLVYKKSFIV